MTSHTTLHLRSLFVWITIGIGLRFTQLTLKSPWTDEFTTMVFSLGNSYDTVPLNQVISLNTLLQPLQPNPAATVATVIHRLFTEDHHPPLYFVLAHWWMQLFPASDSYASLWAARSLPALLGVLSIPGVYVLGWLAFRSRLVAQLAAAIMAVSPYGIYIAQEARHYTLAILWVIASVSCLVIALQHLQRRTLLPIGIALFWVVVNGFGIATHYFFSLTLCAEAIVLLGFGFSRSPLSLRLRQFWFTLYSSYPVAFKKINFSPPASPASPIPLFYWRRIIAVITATCATSLVWLPAWQGSYDPQMTQWIIGKEHTILSLLNPIFQALAAWITMVYLLPVEASSIFVVIVSGLLMLGFFVWAIPILYQGIKVQLAQPQTRLGMAVVGGFVLAAIAIFFAITYLLNTDLTRGARYNFVYFPAVIVLVAAALAVSWSSGETKYSFSQLSLPTKNHQTLHFIKSLIWKTPGQRAIVLIWLMGLLSGITVVSNLGYQKYYRPDLLVPMMQKVSSVPVLIATTHHSLVTTGEMMGIAWEFKRTAQSHKSVDLLGNSDIIVEEGNTKQETGDTIEKKALLNNPQFLLAHPEQEQCQMADCPAAIILQQTLAQLPRPLDLWLVNFQASLEDPLNCFAEDTSQYTTSIDGYNNRLYHCLENNN